MDNLIVIDPGWWIRAALFVAVCPIAGVAIGKLFHAYLTLWLARGR